MLLCNLGSLRLNANANGRNIGSGLSRLGKVDAPEILELQHCPFASKHKLQSLDPEP